MRQCYQKWRQMHKVATYKKNHGSFFGSFRKCLDIIPKKVSGHTVMKSNKKNRENKHFSLFKKSREKQ